MGMPKALVSDDAGSWLLRGLSDLADGGCDRVTVVLGAAAEEARPLLDATTSVAVVVADDWDEGMGASLRAGLRSLADSADDRGRGLAGRPARRGARRSSPGWSRPDVDGRALRAASYDGKPGHPVLLGRDHWAGVVEIARGDQGARDYLAAHDVTLVECGDLATGRDVDSR